MIIKTFKAGIIPIAIGFAFALAPIDTATSQQVKIPGPKSATPIQYQIKQRPSVETLPVPVPGTGSPQIKQRPSVETLPVPVPGTK
jgi:hypothetical protein